MLPEAVRRSLVPIAWVYGAVVRFRNYCYDHQLLRVWHVEVPVISVGNLTVGGTGKTPVVEYIVRYLAQKGERIAVLTRGYGRLTHGPLYIDRHRPRNLTFRETGDEAMQIALKFPEVDVLIDENRARAAKHAVHHDRASVLIMDDGFQHRKLKRDVDIVLFDTSLQRNALRMLPAGMLREPLGGTRRANVVGLTRCDSASANVPELKLGPGASTVRIAFRASSIARLGDWNAADPALLAGKLALAFCGIGNPVSFRQTLESIGIKVANVLDFGDHHPYGDSDFERIRGAFVRCGADVVVTTEKDAVRLRPHDSESQWNSLPLYFVSIEACLVEGEEQFQIELDKILKAGANARRNN